MIKTVLAVVLLLLGFSAQGLFEYKLVLSSNHGLSSNNFFARVLRQKRFHSWKIIVTTETDSSAKLTWNKRFIRYFEIGILDLYVTRNPASRASKRARLVASTLSDLGGCIFFT